MNNDRWLSLIVGLTRNWLAINNNPILNTLRKPERLCTRKKIERLFAQGNGFMCFPYSVRWIEDADAATGAVPPVQVLVGVSKRRLHRAVDRNRVKRLTRECYRLRKQELYDALDNLSAPPILLSLNYVDTQLPDYHKLAQKFDTLVLRLQKEVALETIEPLEPLNPLNP